ncbi:cytochrome C and Quinol oxidase polypeptide I [bacterium BMS3Abin04]|nr:cytochrome C and Quinol oxidase polypeptide I [bacterium BMS3Abin04]
MQSNSITTTYAPPFKIVAKYFIAAIIDFVILNFLLMLNYKDITGFYFQPKILAITHLLTLGWISMTIFGAMFQLVPVVLETKLFSEKLADIQFWIFLLGMIGFVTGFWNSDTGLHLNASAVLLNIAVLIFAVNMVGTFIHVKKWNITGWYLISALIYLIITAIAGFLLAYNLWHPYISINHLQYLKLHAEVAVIGWVTMVVMGVSYKLIPMFTLSHGYSMKSSKWAFWLVNIGLVGINIFFHFENNIIEILGSTLFIAAGIAFFLFQVYLIYKNRLRKKRDIGIKYSIFSFYMLGIVTLFGLIFSFIDLSGIPNIYLVFGYLVLYGYLSMLIVGQMYKIVPFLAWYHKYSSKVGLEPVPMLKDMFNEKYALVSYYLMTTAIIATTASFIFNSRIALLFSFGLMFFGSLIFTFNILTILRK